MGGFSWWGLILAGLFFGLGYACGEALYDSVVALLGRNKAANK